MTTRLRHVFVCQACGQENICDLKEKTDGIAVSCSVCTEEAGEWTRGEWKLEKRDQVTLNSIGETVGRVPREVWGGDSV